MVQHTERIYVPETACVVDSELNMSTGDERGCGVDVCWLVEGRFFLVGGHESIEDGPSPCLIN